MADVRKIAITQREISNVTYHDPRDALSQDWSKYLGRIFPKSVLMPIPNRTLNVEHWLRETSPDLIILSNGEDYGSSEHRDKVEQTILKRAQFVPTPILCICRGMQVLCAINGLKIRKNLMSVTKSDHVNTFHMVRLHGSHFTGVLGVNKIQVNSYHNNGVLVHNIGDNVPLIPFAVCESGVLEGCVHKNLPIMGIQWHPERAGSSESFDELLIRHFANLGSFWKL